MQPSSTYHRKWKFPRPIKPGNGILNSILLLAILNLILASQMMTTKIDCQPILQSAASKKDGSKEADIATSSSNERKPSRLDANESELVQIDQTTSANQSPSLSSSTDNHDNEQIKSPQIERTNLNNVQHQETFQANDLVNLLDLQHEHHQHDHHDTFAELNANAKRRARSISEGFDANEMLEAETDDLPEFIDGSFDQSDGLGENTNDVLGSMSPSIVDSVQKDREAQASSQADLVNRLAMEDQQRKQFEMQTAQARHVARAIEDQHAALSRQHDILMKQQLDEALNDSDNDREWRKTLGNQRQSSSTSASSPEAELSSASGDSLTSNTSDTIAFSDQADLSDSTGSDFQSGESKTVTNKQNDGGENDSASDDDDGDFGPAVASNWAEHYDLAPAAQHHSYGSHYGALHKHQGKYYQ